MKRVTLKEILWVRTIEEGDLRGEVFAFEERNHCTTAVTPEGDICGDPTRAATMEWLSRRATGAISCLTRTHGQVASLPRRHLPWSLVIAGICLLAFATGIASDRIANHKTINVISAPLLAILAWNFLAYLWNLVTLLLPAKRQASGAGIRTLFATAIGIGIGKPHLPPGRGTHPEWEKFRGNFLARWRTIVEQSELLTLAAALHLGAASLALGQIAGLYLGGLIRRYHAVWESTFLDRADFEKLAQFLFAPARWLTGLPVEITAEMEASATNTGVPADNWIHLCAATLFLLVLIPRLGLALMARTRAQSAWRNATGKLDLSDYAAGLLRQASGSGMDVAVITCGPKLPEGAHEQLTRSLQYAIGKPRSLRFLEGPAYGEEDDYRTGLDEAPHVTLLVFPLTTTPEDETQGLLAESVSRAAGTPSQGGGHSIALLFADRFESKFRNLPEFTDRLQEREAAWSHILSPRGVHPITWRTGAPASELGKALTGVLAAP